MRLPEAASKGRFEKSSIKRYFVSLGGTFLSNLLLGTRQTDMTSGFELFTSETLRMVIARGIQSRAHFFQTEIKTYCREVEIRRGSYNLPGRESASWFFRAEQKPSRQLWRLFQLRLKEQL